MTIIFLIQKYPVATYILINRGYHGNTMLKTDSSKRENWAKLNTTTKIIIIILSLSYNITITSLADCSLLPEGTTTAGEATKNNITQNYVEIQHKIRN